MREELEVIYEQIIRPVGKSVGLFTAGLVAGAAGGIAAIVTGELADKNRVPKKVDITQKTCQYKALQAGIIPSTIISTLYMVFGGWGLTLNSAWKGDTKSALLWSLPYITNAGYMLVTGGWALCNHIKEEAQKKRGLEYKIQEKLQKKLTAPRAKNIEAAIGYMQLEEDGSLHVNGNYDEEEKKKIYKNIVRKIPAKKRIELAEKLGQQLNHLQENEKNNPQAIEKYFKGNFGIPITDYRDLTLFHESLIEKESKKEEKRILRKFSGR